MTSSKHVDSRSLSRADVWLMAVAASYWPLGVLGANVVGNPHPERLLILILIVWLLALGLAWLLLRLGVRREVAVPSVFFGVVLLMNGGRLLREFEQPFGWLVLLVVALLWLALITRMAGSVVIRSVTWGLAVALLSGSVISLANTVLGWGTTRVVTTDAPTVTMTETPDIFLVVLDGYPGLATLTAEPGDDKSELVSALESEGFQTPNSAWSSYWSTALSIPSVLQMSYPVEDSFVGEATTQDLYDLISSGGSLVDLLEQQGYASYMVESGWSGSSCSSAFDHCVPSPLLDEAMYLTLGDTVLGDGLDRRLGHPFTLGTEQTMDWLRENGPRLSRDATPTFVLAHLVAPHPPFYLDASCERVVSPDRAGSGLYEPGVQKAKRDQYFLDQMACVDSFMVELAREINSESVVVFISDHGTARDRQLNIPPEDWERSHVSERFNVLASIRVRSGCGLADPLIIPNTFRHVLSCYAAEQIEPVPARMFMPGMIEVDESTVDSLLSGKSG